LKNFLDKNPVLKDKDFVEKIYRETSITHLAEVYHCSPKTFYGVLDYHGIKKETKQERVSRLMREKKKTYIFDIKKATVMYEDEEKGCRVIARKFFGGKKDININSASVSVYQQLKEAGVTMRKKNKGK